MKLLIQALAAAVFFLSFTACSLNEVSNGDAGQEQTDRELRDRARLEKGFSEVLGMYSGEWTHEVVSPLEIAFYTQEKQSGENPDGTTKILKELKARLFRVDELKANYTYFDVRYYKETGELVMVSEQQAGVTSSISISGYLRGEEFTGLMTQAGKTGEIKIRRTTTKTQSGSQQEINQRIREILNRYVGFYQAKVPFGRDSFTMTLDVKVMDYPNSTGGTTPMLLGMANRTDGIDFARQVFFTIQLDQSPIQVSFTTAASSQVNILFTGTAQNGKLVGNLGWAAVNADVEFIKR